MCMRARSLLCLASADVVIRRRCLPAVPTLGFVTQASLQEVVDEYVPLLSTSNVTSGVSGPGVSPMDAGSASGRQPHPSGISRNWSLLYVWLQYCQWYKVLCWLLVLLLGGSEGLIPHAVREAFRVEELLLDSESRKYVLFFGQVVPFVLTKIRHFIVTWAGSLWFVRLIFYSALTSHVEVFSTLLCDTFVAVHLLVDWCQSASNDFSLRLDLNRLRSGYFVIASRHTRPVRARPHAD